MEATFLQTYLREHIPLSAAMGVEVMAVTEDSVSLRAPLAPNINHRRTVFGGSASALAVLAAWSLVHERLRRTGIACRIVIQRNTTEHDLPIEGDFTARSHLRDTDDWPRFLNILERRGRARLKVHAILEYQGAVAGRFEGWFVAVIPGPEGG
jgi:thioesterase domain-containing protein